MLHILTFDVNWSAELLSELLRRLLRTCVARRRRSAAVHVARSPELGSIAPATARGRGVQPGPEILAKSFQKGFFGRIS